MTTDVLAILDKAGIRGADATTMCAAALANLAEPFDIRAIVSRTGLGLRANMTLPELYDGLADAAQAMCPLHYQRAAFALLGADAVRLAGIAAKTGTAA